jgi:diguanylate cyclase (GGDEF)-like protein
MEALDGSFFRSKFARRTFLLFVISAMLPVVLVAALSFEHVSRQLREQSFEQSRQASKAIGMELFRRLSVLASELNTIARQLRSNSADGAALSGVGNASFPDYSALAVMNEDNTLRQIRGVIDPAPLFTPAQEKHLLLGRNVISAQRNPQESFDVLMARLVDPDNPARGTLIGKIPSAAFRSLEFLLPGSTELHVLSADNQVFYASKPIQDSVISALQPLLAQYISGHFEWHSDEAGYLASYWSLFTEADYAIPYLVIVASQPESDVFAPIAAFRTIYVPGLLLAILIVSLVSANQIRKKLSPLIALRDATGRVAGGDFRGRVQIDSDDELAQLGHAFNAMTEKLGTQFTSISTMAEIDRLILSSFDTRYIVATVLYRASELTPCTVAAVLEFDSDRPHVALLSSRITGATAETDEKQVEITTQDVRTLTSNPNGFMPDCARDCPAYLEPIFHDGSPGRRFLVFPTFTKQQLAAVIILGYSKEYAVSQEEQAQLRKFADHVAVALSNASWEERLYHQAHYDTLTNLPNRALLKDRLEQAIARARRNRSAVGVIFADLDRFKLVNDSLGHTTGDLLLKQIAALLLNSVRSVDTIVRFGGDEFVIVVPDMADTDSLGSELGAIAEKLLDTTRHEVVLGDHRVHSEMSIGIALYPKDGETADELIRNADTAMYHAKEHGRGCYEFFAPELTAAVSRRLNLEQELRHALDNDEFELWYQPKIHCASGELTGAEALLRWNHPRRGMVPPFEFIGFAEETGQIQPIGDWVLRTACAQAKAWRDAGLPAIRIAVNLSPRQFRTNDITATVAQTLNACALDSSALELEVTEGTVMENTSESIETLKRLSAMGIRLSVDDFGTGYSSLGYLQKLPIHALKIDRSFIVDMLADSSAQAIVSTTIILAHKLGLDVVAEGVETNDQLELLRTWQCDEMQGYLISRPVNAERFGELLRRLQRQSSYYHPGLTATAGTQPG